MRPTRRTALALAIAASVAVALTMTGSPSPASARSATTTDPVIAAAGNIACDPTNPSFHALAGTTTACRMKYVSDMLLNPDGSAKLAGANYFFFFAAVMFATAVVYVPVARAYRGRQF